MCWQKKTAICSTQQGGVIGLARLLPNARLVAIPSNNGHDGFLLVQDSSVKFWNKGRASSYHQVVRNISSLSSCGSVTQDHHHRTSDRTSVTECGLAAARAKQAPRGEPEVLFVVGSPMSSKEERDHECLFKTSSVSRLDSKSFNKISFLSAFGSVGFLLLKQESWRARGPPCGRFSFKWRRLRS